MCTSRAGWSSTSILKGRRVNHLLFTQFILSDMKFPFCQNCWRHCVCKISADISQEEELTWGERRQVCHFTNCLIQLRLQCFKGLQTSFSLIVLFPSGCAFRTTAIIMDTLLEWRTLLPVLDSAQESSESCWTFFISPERLFDQVALSSLARIMIIWYWV